MMNNTNDFYLIGKHDGLNGQINKYNYENAYKKGQIKMYLDGIKDGKYEKIVGPATEFLQKLDKLCEDYNVIICSDDPYCGIEYCMDNSIKFNWNNDCTDIEIL